MSASLAYTDTGSGSPLILIHGFCEDKSLWQPYVESLSAKYRVLCPDLPGFGQSSADVTGFTINDWGLRLKNWADDLGLRKPLLAGHSLGGYVALAWLAQYPESSSGLAMFHSTAFADTPERQAGREASIARIKEAGSEAFVRALIPGLFANNNCERLRAEIGSLVANALQIAPEVLCATLSAMKNRPDRSNLLGRLTVPVLYIIGKEDSAVPFASSMEQCALAAESHVLILNNVGHMGMLEAPECCLSTLQHFATHCFRRI
jgi:pimeloyl-ACP methyl ester carboxylesterase